MPASPSRIFGRASASPRLGKAGIGVGVALAVLALYVAVLLVFQLGLLLDSAYQHEEARLLFRYHIDADAEAFAGDYLASFVSVFRQPLLYDWITQAWLGAGGDLVLLHRLLPLVCWLAFLAGLAVAARRLGDRVTVLAAVALAAAQPLYLYQITSALPHAFAFPLLIWAFVGLLQNSVRTLSLVTILAGLLYPAIAPLIGLLLAWQVIIAQRAWEAGRTQQVRGAVLLATVGALSLWLLLDALSSPAQLGASLAPMERVETYAENGPEGRHFYGVFNPFTYVAAKAFGQFNADLAQYRLLLLLIYGMVSIYGAIALLRGPQGRGAVLGFVLCAAGVYLLVLAVMPHFVYRFILYPAFTVLPLLFVVGLQNLCRAFAGVLRAPALASLAVLGLLIATLDSFDVRKSGFWWHLEGDSRQVLDFAEAQPTDTLLAIWPSDDEALELLPYLTRRPLFAMYKAHYPTYENHILEMRARMHTLIDAYLATDTAPLRALHCRWGVDHLVVRRAHFRAEGAPPAYFAPFDARIAEIWQEHAPEDFLLHHPPAEAVALETEAYIVLDLRALPAGSGRDCPAAAAGPGSGPSAG